MYNGSETVLKMKLLGANDDMNGGRGPSSHRSQDDAAVGYVFQRHPHETADFPHFSHKQAPQQPRWASGDETIIDVSTHLHLILFFSSNCIFCCCCFTSFSVLLLMFIFERFQSMRKTSQLKLFHKSVLLSRSQCPSLLVPLHFSLSLRVC